MKTVKYNHHGTDVSVMENLKGKHREHCLCFQCAKFNTNDPENKCPHADRLYNELKDEDNAILVAPVWECSEYEGE